MDPPHTQPTHNYTLRVAYTHTHTRQKHWNSFTTPFLISIDDVIAQTTASGRVAIDAAAAEALLKAPLRCNRCGGAAANMPALKAHIAACAAPLP